MHVATTDILFHACIQLPTVIFHTYHSVLSITQFIYFTALSNSSFGGSYDLLSFFSVTCYLFSLRVFNSSPRVLVCSEFPRAFLLFSPVSFSIFHIFRTAPSSKSQLQMLLMFLFSCTFLLKS